jgi:hypothetical protein
LKEKNSLREHKSTCFIEYATCLWDTKAGVSSVKQEFIAIITTTTIWTTNLFMTKLRATIFGKSFGTGTLTGRQLLCQFLSLYEFNEKLKPDHNIKQTKFI